MKKSLAVTLALVFVLGIAGTAFAAANPFVDVPAKHWVYDAVSKLAKAGIVDGYNDGTFRGDKTMTRYEMAQIVAKAMARTDKQSAETKALVDKLAVEFNAELQNLGVRVAKLEANQSNIKFTGDARLRWVNSDSRLADNTGKKDDNAIAYRFGLNMNAQVNENTNFYGRIMTDGHQEFGVADGSKFRLSNMQLDSKNLFGTSAAATVGRFNQKIGPTGYFMSTSGMVDGVKVGFGNQVKVTAGFANFKQAFKEKNTARSSQVVGYMEDAVFATVDYNTSKATKLSAGYVEEKTGDVANDYKVTDYGVTTNFANNFALTGEYLKNTALTTDPYGWIAKINYKGAKASAKDSWGASVEYYKFEDGAVTNGGDWGTAAIANQANDKEAYVLTVNYTLGKNAVLTALQTFNDKKVSDGSDLEKYSRAQIDFFF